MTTTSKTGAPKAAKSRPTPASRPDAPPPPDAHAPALALATPREALSWKDELALLYPPC
ncbi:hypothetical protein KPL78_16105 [Roseomonas sp. HJA6]|uniref:Uncharacterized protein n=1 Tax=Roseomonas alba TaxID=2846776 RepID=A0ABS7AAS1_9PROT|nr:hypothetical protein [Neoroseomonas alba]MBW6399382.1 hypothetical protein [Neoroseomonas alba]